VLGSEPKAIYVSRELRVWQSSDVECYALTG
jgi:hypothetical protein